MSKIGKRLLAMMLATVLLMTSSMPAYAAESDEQSTVGMQEVDEENQILDSEEEKSDWGKSDIGEGGSGEQGDGVTEAATNADGIVQEQDAYVEQAQQTEDLLLCNYILTQDDGEHQSVILEMGEEGSTVLDSAVLYYEDEDGEIKYAEAEEVQENLAAFLLEIPQNEGRREFLSVETIAHGTAYTTTLSKVTEMENLEISEEEAAAVVEETEAQSALGSGETEQIQNCVITAKDEGITAEDIKTAIQETNKLAEQGNAETSVFSLEDNTKGKYLQVQPRDKTHYIVVLDPGHGGSDGGAENHYGSESESKLTLKIAKYLKEELSKYSQITVYMTREDDTYVGLSQRVEYAVNKKADILVSLHLNSFDYNTANGAEVLVPRTGRYNSAVAENAESLAKNILKRITSLGLYDRGLKYRDSENGSTYPDKSTADYFTTIAGGLENGIPSIIVEHAFISGAKDAQYLDSEEDLKNFAKADAYGIAQYFDIETGGENYEEVPVTKGEWKKIDNKWYYYIGNKKQVGWVKIDNSWYYLNESGVMQTGWKWIGGSWYYLNSSGRMLTGWQWIGGKWYYLNNSGSMRTGWQQISGKWYYLNGSGIMQTGWQQISGRWYYLNKNGVMQTGWQQISGKWYYLNGSGAMQTGWQKIYGRWYYLNGSGVMQSGWLKQGNTKYYLYPNGNMAEGWVYLDKKWFYFQPNSGWMRTGWYVVSGKWYYSDSNGYMKTGWQWIGKKWYYLNGSGAMQTGWLNIGGKWYWLDGSGVMQTGWKKVYGRWYYLNGSGVMQNGWLKQGNTWYYLYPNGNMAEGWAYLSKNWYYFQPNSGWMRTGWYMANSKWYYSDTSGHMKTGWLKIGNSWYYLNPSGAMQTGWITIGSKEYFFNSSGVWIEDAKRVEDGSSTQSLYSISGESSVNVEQMVKSFKKSGVTYPAEQLKKGGAKDIETFCMLLKEEADAENIKAEIVFVQAMKETGWLKFGGDIKIEQFNFAGLGATGGGEHGNSFFDVKTGLRAQVQHLKAYGSAEELLNICVDTRFQYVERNSAPYVEWLGIPDNPDGKGWAAAKGYGYDLVEMIKEIKKL